MDEFLELDDLSIEVYRRACARILSEEYWRNPPAGVDTAFFNALFSRYQTIAASRNTKQDEVSRNLLDALDEALQESDNLRP